MMKCTLMYEEHARRCAWGGRRGVGVCWRAREKCAGYERGASARACRVRHRLARSPRSSGVSGPCVWCQSSLANRAARRRSRHTGDEGTTAARCAETRSRTAPPKPTLIKQIMLVAVSVSLAGALMAPTSRVGVRAGCPSMGLSGEEQLIAKFGLPTPESIVATRRSALGLGLAAAAAAPLVGFSQAAMAEDAMFTLPPLPYDYVRSWHHRCSVLPRAHADVLVAMSADVPHLCALPTGCARAVRRCCHDEIPPRLPPPGVH